MQAVTTEQENTSALSARGRLEAFIELTKPRIAFLLVLTSAAGYYAGSIGTFDTLLFVHSMLGITLLAFGVATLNQWYERAIDPLMERTAGRPIPAGKVTPTEALVFGISQCLVAELYLLFFVNILTAALGLTVIAGYVLVYIR